MNLRSFLLSLSLLSLPRLGLAQSVPPVSDRSAPAAELARQRGHEGLQEFSAGRFRSAREAFEAADKLAHSPVFVLYRARALRQLGQFLEAREAYEQCAEEPLTESAPVAWVRAVDDARREMQQLRLVIPALRLRIEGEPSFPLEIAWQRQRVILSDPSSAGHGETILEGNPGLWEIHLKAADGAEIRLHYAGRIGRRSDALAPYFPVKTSLPQRQEVVSQPQRQEAVSFKPPPDQPRFTARTWGAIAAFSCGGVSLITGSVAFSMALAQARSVREGCLGSSCLRQDQERANSAHRLANLATAGFVIGAVGATTGLGLLFLPGGERGDPRSAQSRGGVRLSASVSGIDLSGRF